MIRDDLARHPEEALLDAVRRLVAGEPASRSAADNRRGGRES